MGFFSELLDGCFSVGHFTPEGVEFVPDNILIPWNWFRSIETTDEGCFGNYKFELFGGITFVVHGSNFNDQTGTEVNNQKANKYFCDAQKRKTYPKIPSNDDFFVADQKRRIVLWKMVFDLYSESLGLFEKLENTAKNGNVTVHFDGQSEYLLLIANWYQVILSNSKSKKISIKGLDTAELQKWIKNSIDFQLQTNIFANMEQFADEMEDANERKLMAGGFCTVWTKLGFANNGYDYLRVAASMGYNEPFVRDRVKTFLAKAGEELGLSSNVKLRKVIACTKEIGKVDDNSKAEFGTFVTLAEDLEEYNSCVSQDSRIRFLPGHPRNGCTYVQYPFDKNLYAEVNEFHDMVRERKQNELLRLLESLGAYSAKVEVRHTQNSTSNTNSSTQINGSGSRGDISIQGASSNSNEIRETSSRAQSLAQEFSFNPPEAASIPNDLVFFPTEESWQQMAKSVMRGGLKHAVVDLEYKTEYGIDEKYLSDVSASLKALIPSYEMNLKNEFSSELQQLETTQWHYEVSFENEKGDRASSPKKSDLQEHTEGTASKAELLFLRRARRYAQSDVHINAEQRSDLESFAQKYGIDGLRMEELIEEAFE